MADKYVSTAKVIDGVLILSLPDAITPVVWQMELGQSKSSALEIRTTDKGEYVLTLKTPRQDILEIATYAHRDHAIKALMVTASAMEKAHGQLRAHAPNEYPVPVITHAPSSAVAILKKIMKILAILFAGLVGMGLILLVVGKLFLNTPSTGPATTQNTPMSAEEFLGTQ